MITKILKIQNIGRLRETGGSNNKYELAKTTLIYAGNTHGKSTFTAILRSLRMVQQSNLIVVGGHQRKIIFEFLMQGTYKRTFFHQISK